MATVINLTSKKVSVAGHGKRMFTGQGGTAPGGTPAGGNGTSSGGFSGGGGSGRSAWSRSAKSKTALMTRQSGPPVR